MRDHDLVRLTEGELHSWFERLFPHGCASPDIVAEIAPEGWEASPLLACFHPAVERIFEEQRRMHQRVEELGRSLASRRGRKRSARARTRRPTLAELRRDHQPRPVRQDEEIMELVGMCLWDVFSDNHQVTAADGRMVDLGSWRSSSAFLDEYLCGDRNNFRGGDYLRFYMGSAWIEGRADLALVYRLIFRRLRAVGADWEYCFPELYLVDITKPVETSRAGYSVSKGARDTLEAQRRVRAMEKSRKELAEIHARAREEAMDRLPPATVRAYREIYGRNPRGWPPA